MLELALRHADQGCLDRSAIEVAHDSAQDLLELIGDILDIARIESGHLTLSPERANPKRLTESVVRMFDGLARQKSLDLNLQVDSRLDTDVLIDPMRFRQILSNLISNAIKFTPGGQVRVSLQSPPAPQPGQLALHLSVRDTGIGISAADRQRLFEPFAQADNTGQMARSGAGLGLVICRNLAQMMGGSLLLDSEPGEGTCVTLSLVLEMLDTADQPLAMPLPEPAASKPLHVLVVDDHPANRLLLSQQLAFLGHRCAIAEQGAQGLQAWQEQDFDLLMVDCNMPVMNGYELTRTLRAHELETQRLPCIIWGFTANAQPEEVQRCLEAGMDDCLFKPIGLTALGERLANLSPSHNQACVAGQPSPFNPDSLSHLTGNRPELIHRLLSQLLHSSRQDRQALALLASHEHQAIREIAHRIKGAMQIISARPVVEACEALEQSCDATSTLKQLNTCRQRVDQALHTLEKALEARLSPPG